MVPQQPHPATAVKEPKIDNARIKEPKRKGPLRRFENGLLNVDRKSGKHIKATKHNAEIPLLTLPGEIRNLIWGYALGGHTFEATSRERVRSGYRVIVARVTNQPRNCFALMQACRQIYAETALLPQEVNAFSFHTWLSYDFILRFPRIRQEAIRDVRIVTYNPLYLATLLFRLSVDLLPGLQRVVVEFRKHDTFGRTPAEDVAHMSLPDAQKELARNIWNTKKTRAELVFEEI